MYAKTALGRSYNPNFIGIPDGMPGLEYEIWQRWKEFAVKSAIRLWFYVRLGAGKRTKSVTKRTWPVGPLSEDKTPRLEVETRPHQVVNHWVPNTQIQAHVVIEYDQAIWIVEIRTMANSNSIGRLLTQKRLWAKDNPVPKKEVELVIVTDYCDDDARDTCQDLNIKYFIV